MNKGINILVSLLIILTSCSVSETPTGTSIAPTLIEVQPTKGTIPISDGGLISGEPCASPCFFGIQVGETPLNEVIPTLHSYDLSPCEAFNERIIVCGEGVFSITIGADASTAIVDGITYYPSVPISVGDIIKKYGNPNSLYVETEWIPDAMFVHMFILWDVIRMRVDLPNIPDTGQQVYVIEDKTKVRSITFLNESSYSSLATNGSSQPWKGYRAYKP